MPNLIGAPTKVLVIENDDAMRELIKAYLGKLNSEVTTLQSTDNLATIFDSVQYELIIFDWKNKKPTGKEILDTLRSNPATAKTPVILVSGLITQADIAVAKADPLMKFIIKPFAEEVFLSTVSKFFHINFQAKNGKNNIMVVKGSPLQGQDVSVDKGLLRRGTLGIEVDKHQRSSSASATQEMTAAMSKGSVFIDRGSKKAANNDNERETTKDSSFTIRQENLRENTKQNLSVQSLMQDDPALDLILKSSSDPKSFDFEPESSPQNSCDLRDANFQTVDSIFRHSQTSSSKALSTNPKTGSSALKNQDTKANDVNASQYDGFYDTVGGAKNSAELITRKPASLKDSYVKPHSQLDTGSVTYRQANVEARGNQGSYSIDPGDTLQISQEGAILSSDESVISARNDSFDVQKKRINLPTSLPLPQFNEYTAAIRKVLVGDADPVLRGMLKTYLDHLRVENVTYVATGASFWDRFCHEDFDLIILDWNLKKPVALAIYNRVRRDKKHMFLPTIVTTGHLSEADFKLLEENQCTVAIEKPLQFTKFNKSLNALMKKSAEFEKIVVAIEKQIKADPNNKQSILATVKRLARTMEFPVAGLLKAGEEVFESGKFDLAHSIFLFALTLEENNPVTLTWLGKSLLMMGRHNEALAALSKAHGISSQNIERLCLMGEVGLTLQDPEKARAHFQSALKIDHDDPKAKAGVLLADNLGNYQSHEATKNEPLPRALASTLNTIGIALARSRRCDRAIEQYTASLCFIRDAKRLGAIQFNIALAYMRKRDYENAKKWFEKSAKTSPEMTSKTLKHLDIISRLPASYIANVKILRDDNIDGQ